MKTIDQLKQELKDSLLENGLNYVNDGSLTAIVNENIQWAWENWGMRIWKGILQVTNL